MGRGEGEEGGGKEGIPEVKHRRKRVFINICSDFRSPVITKSGGGSFVSCSVRRFYVKNGEGIGGRGGTKGTVS